MEHPSVQRPEAFNGVAFSPVVRHAEELPVFDFATGYDADAIARTQWGIGRYDERRLNMYTAPQYEKRRNIHMGIDIWTPAGEPVFAFYDGRVAYTADHNRRGDYGPTLVTYHLVNGLELYSLYGHLTKDSIVNLSPGDVIQSGQKIGAIGTSEVNGGWEPHLHFQLSWNDPGKADMPGVVSSEEHETALCRYPDPRIVLGKLY